jgi:hypothetical protein
MGDSIEDIDNVSGSPSPSTIDYRRHAPGGDTLAGAGRDYGSSPLRGRNPTLVHADDEGFHNAVLRTAARRSAGRPDDPTAFLVGLESHGTPANGVKEISDGD